LKSGKSEADMNDLDPDEFFDVLGKQEIKWSLQELEKNLIEFKNKLEIGNRSDINWFIGVNQSLFNVQPVSHSLMFLYLTIAFKN